MVASSNKGRHSPRKRVKICSKHKSSKSSQDNTGIRPGKVLLGKKLVKNVNYPSEDVLDEVVEKILDGEIADK